MISPKALITSLILLPLHHTFAVDEEGELALGVEVATGYRSEYIFRGFELSEDWLDVQLQGEYAFNNTNSLQFGVWYGSETGDGDFTETGVFTDFTVQKDDYQYGLSLTYRSFDSSEIFDSGLDIGLFTTYHLSDNLDLGASVHYDFGADGFYSNIETNYYRVLNEDAYLSYKLGISAVEDYYGRNGLNDLYYRITFTYDINSNVSISPFLGTSIQLDSDNGGDSLHGGVWFEVSF